MSQIRLRFIRLLGPSEWLEPRSHQKQISPAGEISCMAVLLYKHTEFSLFAALLLQVHRSHGLTTVIESEEEDEPERLLDEEQKSEIIDSGVF